MIMNSDHNGFHLYTIYYSDGTGKGITELPSTRKM